MIQVLPITEKARKWSYIYAYNLRTIRDIFVYCVQKGTITEKQLYADMAQNVIQAPGKEWVNSNIRRKERLRLEYVHAAEYLGFIKRNNKMVDPNLDNFVKEKKTIINSNKNRIFTYSSGSTELNQAEKNAIANIIFNYERLKDYLFWFLDFDKYKKADNIKLKDFVRSGKPIYLLSKTIADKKGSNTISKGMDGTILKIPDSYIRLANSVFPNWLKELELIDKVTVFPEFSYDKQIWHMFYPIKTSDEDFIKKNIVNILSKMFHQKRVWLPKLLYEIALKYSCSITAIKNALKKIYREKNEYFYFERTSLSLMRKHSKYEDSYIEINGFFRSNLIFKRR